MYTTVLCLSVVVDRQTTSTMETEDKEDVAAEIHLQVVDPAREDSQLTRSHNHDLLFSHSQTSTVSTTRRFSANVPVHSSDDDHDVLQSIKSEDVLSDELKAGRGLLR